ncbi:MAG TPA: hypothetical protein DEF18_15635 [Muricauda sp.]|uniref:PsbP C-terminal domain-containing protein n=1 Tax=Flagellimonas aurea TaxID=2915619 RepID=A0ABS3G5F6_9FLAO|nr:hypothetical protein [Allomuricauda aurea]MAO16154.1 hypothetical protein [Allomuricauda sp.]MBO0354158.1 hypothetical protein [Allomuricauda aurea]HBU79528.1 hypothetical protein [Allomuricauda sp.]|tara:strand:+ start:567 stop:1154 length:588 start_codon:yes stop_codon:yes gene_type:complete
MRTKFASIFVLSILFCSACKNFKAKENDSEPKDENFNTVGVNNEYQIEIPRFMNGTTGLNEEASLQYQSLRHEAYLLIIDEPKLGFEQVYRDLEQYDDELSVLQNYRDARIQILSRTTKIINKFNSKPFKINGLDAEFLELEAKVNGVEDEIFYFLTFVDGGEKVYMIMAWTVKNRKEEHKKTFKTIAESFELID